MKMLVMLLSLMVGFNAHSFSLHRMSNEIATSKQTRVDFKNFVEGWKIQQESIGDLALDDQYQQFVDFFVKYVGSIFGDEVAKIILEATAIPAVKVHLIDFYDHVSGMFNKDTCIDNAPKAFEDFVFLAVVAGAVAYNPMYVFPAIQVGELAGQAGKFMFLKVGADYKICGLING